MNRLSRALILSIAALLWSQTACRTTGTSSLRDDETEGSRITQQNIWDYKHNVFNGPMDGYIKFSIFVDAEGQPTRVLWHPSRHAFHQDYLVTLPEFAGLERQQFDNITLFTQGRRLLLGTVLFPRDEENFRGPWEGHVELISEDDVDASVVSRVFALLQAAQQDIISALKYLPIPGQRNYVATNAAAFAQAGVQIAEATVDDRDVCYSSGWTVGRVKMVREAELEDLIAAGEISADHILVLDRVPREPPLVAGLVTAEQTSPSSHAALLSQMADNPFVFQKDAFESEFWRGLASSNQPIFFKATGEAGQGCTLRFAKGGDLTAEEATRLKRYKRPGTIQLPDIDNSAVAVLDLADLSYRDGSKVGAKAANVGQIMDLIPDRTVDKGLAIPLTFFKRYLASGTTSEGESIQEAMAGPLQQALAAEATTAEIDGLLKEVRKIIDKGRMPEGMEQAILGPIAAKFAQGTRIRLRSSSNVEDNLQFNGAGLYESKGACVGDDSLTDEQETLCAREPGDRDPDRIIKSVKKVWAGLYTLKGFSARRFYGMDESKAAMGILVHESSVGELARGVAITSIGTSWQRDQTFATITGFPGDQLEVTNPEPGRIPETTRIGESDYAILVHSTELPQGRQLLNPEEYAELHGLLKRIDSDYRARMPETLRGSIQFDMEWKLVSVDGRRQLHVKQVRPIPPSARNTHLANRGKVIMGKRDVVLCPSVEEDPDGLKKLMLSKPLRVSMGLYESPLGSQQVDSPVSSIDAWQDGSYHSISRGSQAVLQESEWHDSETDSRSFAQLKHPLTIAGVDNPTFTAGWALERRLADPEFLLSPVLAFDEVGLAVTADTNLYGRVLDGGVPYRVMEDPAVVCEQDAYQGIQPGTAGLGAYAAGRAPPYRVAETWEALNADGIKVTWEGRSAVQGFDKTMFMKIDRVVINGLTSAPLTITENGKAVYAAAHHNFSFQYAFDLWAAEGLTEEQRQDLEESGKRYFVFPAFDENFFEGITHEGGEIRVTAAVYSSDGRRTDLPDMKRTAFERDTPVQ